MSSHRSSYTLSYLYDHSNQRVSKALATSSLTVTPSPYYSEEDGTVVKYILANGVLAATIRGSGASSTAYFIHTDHLGSTEKISNASGTIAELTDYFPYGAIRQNNQYSLNDRKGYIGKDFDSETVLSYLEARYYKVKVGRFISQDPMFWKVGGQRSLKQKFGTKQQRLLEDPQQLNSYSYGRNNPMIFKDPDGRESVGVSIGGSIEGGLGRIGPYGAGTFSIGVGYVRNPETGQAWLTFPITFGVNAGIGEHYVGYPKSDKAPAIAGVNLSPNYGPNYGPNITDPEELRGEEEATNINTPLGSISVQGEGTKSANYSVSGPGPRISASLSQYQVKSWAPSVNITWFVNAISNIQNQINRIQAQINDLKNQAADALFGPAARPQNY